MDKNIIMESSKHYGIDINDMMIDMLSEELSKEIDKEILRNMGLIPEKNKRRIDKIEKILKKNETT